MGSALGARDDDRRGAAPARDVLSATAETRRELRAPADSESGPRAAPGAWTIAASLALLCAIWGSTYLVIRESLDDLPPFLSAGMRFALAGLVLTLLAPRMSRHEGGARPTLGLSLAMGLCAVATSYGIVYWTETIVPSSLVSVLWSIYPLFIALSGHFFLPGERLRPVQWLGLVLGFAGVVLLFATDLRAIGPGALPAGAVLLLSPLSSTVGNTLIKRHGSGTSSAYLNRNGMLIGASALLALSAAVEREAPVHWTPRAAWCVVYLALAGTVVTFSLYYWLLRHTPATRLALIAYLIPVLALTLGALVGGEPVGWHTLAGCATVLAGVALVHRRRH